MVSRGGSRRDPQESTPNTVSRSGSQRDPQKPAKLSLQHRLGLPTGAAEAEWLVQTDTAPGGASTGCPATSGLQLQTSEVPSGLLVQASQVPSGLLVQASQAQSGLLVQASQAQSGFRDAFEEWVFSSEGTI